MAPEVPLDTERHPMRNLSALFLVAVVCAASLPVLAQTPKSAPKDGSAGKPAAAPVPAAPERTTASFGDWVLRCESVATQSRRVCEAAHLIVAQGQTAPVAQVAIGRAAPNEDERLTIVVPPNIAIGIKPRIMMAKASATPIELAWQRCLPGACFASATVSSALIGELAAQAEPGRIMYKSAADRDAELPLSFRGLSQAMAALAKEP